MIHIQILDKIFNNKALKIFIPPVNQIITFYRRKKLVRTYFDKTIKRYVYREGHKVVFVDVHPTWVVTYDKLLTHVTDICCKLYAPTGGDVVVDVGAGVGEETLIFADLVGMKGRVFAIEAHPETAFSLRKMCQFNKYGNVEISQVALGSKNGDMFMEDRTNHEANRITESNEATMKVPMMTFDDYVHKNRIRSIDFVKMNIEGEEENVILGMANSIKIIRNIAIGCHDFLEKNNGNRIKNMVKDFLKENDFSVKTFQCRHVVRADWVYGTKII